MDGGGGDGRGGDAAGPVAQWGGEWPGCTKRCPITGTAPPLAAGSAGAGSGPTALAVVPPAVPGVGVPAPAAAAALAAPRLSLVASSCADSGVVIDATVRSSSGRDGAGDPGADPVAAAIAAAACFTSDDEAAAIVLALVTGTAAPGLNAGPSAPLLPPPSPSTSEPAPVVTPPAIADPVAQAAFALVLTGEAAVAPPAASLGTANGRGDSVPQTAPPEDANAGGGDGCCPCPCSCSCCWCSTGIPGIDCTDAICCTPGAAGVAATPVTAAVAAATSLPCTLLPPPPSPE